MSDQSCCVCDELIPDEYTKFDPKAPVFDEDNDQVYHLGCEGEMFEEVHCSV